jgi:uncharacterized protein involved in exopolysaccharide biosynthesis
MNDIHNNSEFSENQITVKYEDDFSFSDVIEIVSQARKYVMYTTLAFLLASTIYIFLSPNLYSSSSLLAIIDDSEAGGSGFQDIASRYGGLASLAGVAIATDSASKSDLVMETIKSRDFFEHLSNIPELYPSLVAALSYDAKTKKLTFDSKIYDSLKMAWVADKPSILEAHRDFLNNMIISKDKRTGFIYIAFQHISPEFAFKMATAIISEVNDVIRQQHLEESERSVSYLNQALKNTIEIGTKSSITTLLEAQLKVQMIANVRQEYVVRAIDKPYLPEWKAGPARVKFVFLSSLLGFIISALFALYLHYFSGNKK